MGGRRTTYPDGVGGGVDELAVCADAVRARDGRPQRLDERRQSAVRHGRAVVGSTPPQPRRAVPPTVVVGGVVATAVTAAGPRVVERVDEACHARRRLTHAALRTRTSGVTIIFAPSPRPRQTFRNNK